ncbi:hypothetical protein KQX54_019604 [Cotesia glomerata]|uniref:Secreted protein n=1 Tax=Cotesia glomerata TaxID=32391 RepID=A0AAV7I0J7_COTGL|nr:hypothetical protein KQX54_019604 [Cotesia glomerata]
MRWMQRSHAPLQLPFLFGFNDYCLSCTHLVRILSTAHPLPYLPPNRPPVRTDRPPLVTCLILAIKRRGGYDILNSLSVCIRGDLNCGHFGAIGCN